MSLDSCISSIFEPGNPGNATDSGALTIPRYSMAGAIIEAAAAADSPNASLFAIYIVAVTETATAADAPSASVVAVITAAVAETVTAAETQDGTVVGPTRSAMLPGAFINSSTSREANVAGTMVNS